MTTLFTQLPLDISAHSNKSDKTHEAEEEEETVDFTPNGLLGGARPGVVEQKITSAAEVPEAATVTDSKASGVHGNDSMDGVEKISAVSPSKGAEAASEEDEDEDSFIPNGLLGCISSEPPAPFERHDDHLDEDMVPNGLLGGGLGASSTTTLPQVLSALSTIKKAPPQRDYDEMDMDLDLEMEIEMEQDSVYSPSKQLTDVVYDEADFIPNDLLSSVTTTPTDPRSKTTPTSATTTVTTTRSFVAPLSAPAPIREPPAHTTFRPVNAPVLPTLMASNFEGDVVSLKRRYRIPKPSNPTESTSRTVHGTLQLLTQPLQTLLREVADLVAQDEHRALLESAKAASSSSSASREKVVGDGKMWTQRYSPKNFTELLIGDERVNRDAMAWVREWDFAVFGRAHKEKKRKTWSANPSIPEAEAFKDPYGRPREKLLLLSGPPGLGKTTLANIMARQAGYHVLEINASDDRNAGTVTNRIKNAVEAGSGLDSKRPTLVVIDEIDGVGGGGDTTFISSLLKLVSGGGVGGGKTKKKGKDVDRPIMRPIICICNDLYAPALRPLRPHARIVRFTRPSVGVMVNRLKGICDNEKLKADTRCLTMLVEATNCDVRSCLNTLQFIRSKTATLTPEILKSATVGLKDAGVTHAFVWNSMFVPMTAKRAKAGIAEDGGSNAQGKWVERVMRGINSCGEFERLQMGAFEHYPTLKWLDTNFTRVNRVHDWINFYDCVQSNVNEHQNWEMMGYMGFSIAAWYHDFASIGNSSKTVEFPRQDYEHFVARSSNEEIATTLTRVLPPSLRSSFTATTICSEFAPLLMRILSPSLRPINAQVIKPSEKTTLARLVDLMISHKLSFYQERGEDGQLVYRLDPPLDVFIQYEGKRATDIATSRYAIRHLVATEIEAKRLKDRAAVFALETTHQFSDSSVNVPSVETSVDKPALDFFGRVLVKKPVQVLVNSDITNDSTTPAPPPRKKYKIFYEHRDGSSSAVRKPIKMSSLM